FGSETISSYIWTFYEADAANNYSTVTGASGKAGTAVLAGLENGNYKADIEVDTSFGRKLTGESAFVVSNGQSPDPNQYSAVDGLGNMPFDVKMDYAVSNRLNLQ